MCNCFYCLSSVPDDVHATKRKTIKTAVFFFPLSTSRRTRRKPPLRAYVAVTWLRLPSRRR